MPHLQLTMPEITLEQRQQLVKNLTETVGNILSLSDEMRQRVSIVLNMYTKSEVSRGGKLIANQHQNVYHIDLYTPVLNFEQKRELARHLTNSFCDTLGLKPQERETVFVTIQQFGPENLATGGRLMAELAYA